MNRLPPDRRAEVLLLLCQGAGMRGVSRATGVSVNTAAKLLAEAGAVCAQLDTDLVRGLRLDRVDCYKSWSRDCGAEAGVWTWSAVAAESDLVVAFRVGGLDAATAGGFLDEIARRTGMASPRLSDDAVAGLCDDAPFGLDLKLGRITEAGEASAGIAKRIQTRRFTRLRNAYSKRIETFSHMVALYTFWINFMKIGENALTPAMAAGLAERPWTPADIFALIDPPKAAVA